jgi:hypothetical protein
VRTDWVGHLAPALSAVALVMGAGAAARASSQALRGPAARPRLSSRACAPALLADGEPEAVVILADGISSTVASGAYTPADITGTGWHHHAGGYCVPYTPGQRNARAVVAAAGLPAPLASLYADYAGGLLPGYRPRARQWQLLTNLLARAGAVIVPFSYRGATLRRPAAGRPLATAVLEVAASGAADPGSTVPRAAAATLQREVASLHAVWPLSRILVVGHSEAGLVTEVWWQDFWLGGNRDPVVESAFSLDGPVNGVANANVCVTGVCGPLHISPDVARVWQALWNENQSAVGGRLIRADEATGDRFIAVGTQSDPVYDLGDAPLNNGLGSQMWHTGACVSDRVSCDYRHPMDLSSVCATNATSGPPGSMDGHGLVMNCANVEAAILGRLATAEAAARAAARRPGTVTVVTNGSWLARPGGRRVRVECVDASAWTTIAGASWIYANEGQAACQGAAGAGPGTVPAGAATLWTAFVVPGRPRAAVLEIAADNSAVVYVNGKSVDQVTGYGSVSVQHFSAGLREGSNTLTIVDTNAPGGGYNPAGVIAKLTVTYAAVSNG